MFRKPLQNFESVDAPVKSSLILRLKECVSEIVMKYTAESWVTLKNEEATNMLCWILEAVFIHGLKNTFIKSLSIFSSRRESSIPNPSFWDFVMIFSHRDVIEQIRKLNFVNTDVGRSRAWIRITLNEMSLVSYLENMFRNPSYVRSFYKPNAFLRDSEKCDILKNYLVGVVETCKFDLVIDNSLLNQWNSGPLALVGLWIDDNIVQGIDVAQNMDSKDLQAIPQLGKPKTPEPQFMAALRRQPLLAEEDALRIIMASKPSSTSNAASAASSRRNSDAGQSKDQPLVGSYPSSSGSQFLGVRRGSEVPSKSALTPGSSPNQPKIILDLPIPNCPNPGQINSIPIPSNSKISEKPMDQEPCVTAIPVPEESCVVMNVTIPEVTKPEESSDRDEITGGTTDEENEELTFVELLTAYNKDKKMGTEIYKSSVPSDQEYCGSTATETETADETTSSVDIQETGEDRFEIITNFNENPCVSEMLPSITKYAGKIVNEIGMDMQHYSCKFCRSHIGMSFAPARLCHFTGNYFCTSCHLQDRNVIPSRILLNWDFTSYEVCKLAKELLEEIKDQPMFDLESINPKLYSYIDELVELRDLRTKLNYVSMYLKTCKDPTILEEFKKEIWPREHFFESVHLYSLSDLLNVTNRTLAIPLSKLYNHGKSHIVSCKICKAKGFVCEICRNPEVIFPFSLESIYKCRSCGAVYHDKCMNHSKPCPRCARWKDISQDD